MTHSRGKGVQITYDVLTLKSAHCLRRSELIRLVQSGFQVDLIPITYTRADIQARAESHQRLRPRKTVHCIVCLTRQLCSGCLDKAVAMKLGFFARMHQKVHSRNYAIQTN